LVEFRSVELVKDVEGGFLFGAEVFEPFLLEQPVLIGGAGMPVGDVARSDALGVGAEPGEEFGVWQTVAEHGIDFVADGFGQAGDFAFGRAGLRDFGFWTFGGAFGRWLTGAGAIRGMIGAAILTVRCHKSGLGIWSRQGLAERNILP